MWPHTCNVPLLDVTFRVFSLPEKKDSSSSSYLLDEKIKSVTSCTPASYSTTSIHNFVPHLHDAKGVHGQINNRVF